MRRRIFALAAVAGLVAALGASAGAARERGFNIRLSTQGLAPLKGSFYELWVIKGRRKISAGKFKVGSSGKLVNLAGRPVRFVSPLKPATVDAIAVTIEPSPDRSPKPSGIIVLAGKPGAAKASLRFPVDLSSIAGSFILATPTDSDSANENAGVWFLRLAAGPQSSLNLPALPAAGWVWEGWAATQKTPISTGRFTSASGADRSSAFSGPTAGPPFPGEDFLLNLPAGVAAPVNLADGSSLIVLTIEPDLQGRDPTGKGPFSIKPLVAKVAAGAADHSSIQLGRDLSGLPVGTARF